MKFGLYTDTHFGIFGDDENFLKYQLSVISKIHKNFLDMDINRIVIPGDMFDDRRRLNVKTMNIVKKFYEYEIDSKGFSFVILRGNHDYYNKTDNKYYSLNIFENTKDVFLIEDDYGLVDQDGFKILYCNWIFDEYQFKEKIKEFSPNLIIGHFEMKGFEMVKGHVMKTGMDKDILKSYEKVISGHYHIKQEQDNIIYLGTSFQLDWNDYNVPKFYYTYDTRKRELNAIEQKDCMFLQVKITDIVPEIFDCIEGKILKLIIDSDDFDKNIITKLQEKNPFRLQIVDNREIIKEVQEEIDTNTDVLTISKEYIEKNISEDVDKDKLFDIFSEVYKEARTL